jgi:hypothetical protein
MPMEHLVLMGIYAICLSTQTAQLQALMTLWLPPLLRVVLMLALTSLMYTMGQNSLSDIHALSLVGPNIRRCGKDTIYRVSTTTSSRLYHQLVQMDSPSSSKGISISTCVTIPKSVYKARPCSSLILIVKLI